MADITLWLKAAFDGDQEAANRVFQSLYQELHEMAARSSQGPLQSTSLVHEAWLRLAAADTLDFQSRQHFFATAARIMRQISIDRFRREHAEKRGGAIEFAPLEEGIHAPAEAPRLPLLALDQALKSLEQVDAEAAQLVELRYFAGLPLDQVATVMGLSERTLKRRWRVARAFLHRQLEASHDDA